MLEYKLSGLTNLLDHVVPFYLKYVIPFSGKAKEFNTFLEILERKQRKEHFTQEGLIDMVKLVYTLNEEGKGKRRKRALPFVSRCNSYDKSGGGTCYYQGQRGILANPNN